MATRLKVDKSVLLEKLRAERAKQAAAYARDTETYSVAVAEFGDKVRIETEKFLVQLEKNPAKAMERVDTHYSRGAYITFANLRRPTKPTLSTGKLDRLIRTLEAATDTVIPVSADDDFAAYL
jgi:hypothetical protein